MIICKCDQCPNEIILIFNKMQKQLPTLSESGIKHLDKIQISDSTKRSNYGRYNLLQLTKLYINREILSQCLETLDIFKEILEDPVQKNKIIRDVTKAIKLKVFQEEAIIYNKGENSSSIYMVIKGNVSLCMPVLKEQSHENTPITDVNQRIQFQYQEIDSFETGEGFGEAEFIHGKKRSLVAKAKSSDTIIGVIDGKDFEEVIQNYKQRVYFKKIDMFGKCPLLQNLQPYQLQFIVNNAKPFTFTISREIVKQDEKSDALYLITEGQVQLRRIHEKQEQKTNKYSTKSKTSVEDAVKQKIKIKSIVVGVLQEGEFLGDGEIALGIPFSFSAICKSEKVRAYICDERIILSQMTPENFESAKRYYQAKRQYRENKSNIYQQAKSRIQRRIENDEICILDKKQMQMKKMISNRYVEKIPSLIGKMSPRDIGKIVDRKYSKLKQPLCLDESELNCFPSIHPRQVPFEMLKADERAYSPLLKKSQIQQRKYSQGSSPSPNKQTHSLSVSHNPYYLRQTITNTQQDFGHSQPSSLLVLLRPFHKKVQSLHQRLAKEYGHARRQKKKELDRISAKLTQQSYVEAKRMSEFITKIKEAKKQ